MRFETEEKEIHDHRNVQNIDIRELDKTHRTNHKKDQKMSERDREKSGVKNVAEQNEREKRGAALVHEIQQDMNERLYMKQKTWTRLRC